MCCWLDFLLKNDGKNPVFQTVNQVKNPTKKFTQSEEMASQLGCRGGLLNFRCEWFSIPRKRSIGGPFRNTLTCVRTLKEA